MRALLSSFIEEAVTLEKNGKDPASSSSVSLKKVDEHEQIWRLFYFMYEKLVRAH